MGLYGAGVTVGGSFESTTGHGVYGSSSAEGKSGIYGTNVAPAWTTTGRMGVTGFVRDPDENTMTGRLGYTSISGGVSNNYGVWGNAGGIGSTIGYGVYGTGKNYGVYGYSSTGQGVYGSANAMNMSAVKGSHIGIGVGVSGTGATGGSFEGSTRHGVYAKGGSSGAGVYATNSGSGPALEIGSGYIKLSTTTITLPAPPAFSIYDESTWGYYPSTFGRSTTEEVTASPAALLVRIINHHGDWRTVAVTNTGMVRTTSVILGGQVFKIEANKFIAKAPASSEAVFLIFN
jgi:hypothetical protein